MKKIFIAISLLLPSVCVIGQISLEHTYMEGSAYRIDLDVSGEKYYVLDQNSNKLLLFNADHTPWKTINLPVGAGMSVSSLQFSEKKINSDNLIEVYYSTAKYTAPVQLESKIINENGNVLLSVNNASGIYLSEIDGKPAKILCTLYNNPNTSSVYSVPALTVEHNYSEGVAYRIDLDVSGEKYYVLDQNSNKLLLFNADHTPWKTINLPVGAGMSVSSLQFSEKKINSDNLIEVYYSTAKYTAPVQLESKIINENGNVLLSVNNASGIYLSEIDGKPAKILCTLYNNPNTSSVYSVPALTVEHNYSEGIAYRIDLDVSGEKYYVLDQNSNKLLLFNADHMPWKTINLPVGAGMSVSSLQFSEKKINSDNLIEVYYSIAKYTAPVQLESKIINENGNVLLSVNNASGIYLSEIAGKINKIIASLYGTPTNTQVYSTPVSSNLNLEEIEKNNQNTTLYPNPATYAVSIKTEEKYNRINIINILGQIVLNTNQIGTVDISSLQIGHYMLVGKQDEKTVFIKKLVIQ